MTLSYCSLSCCSSASWVKARCCMIENVPSTPQATATVNEMARIRRAAIDRSLNIGGAEAFVKERFGNSQKFIKNCERRTGLLRIRQSAQATEWQLCSVAQAGEE